MAKLTLAQALAEIERLKAELKSTVGQVPLLKEQLVSEQAFVSKQTAEILALKESLAVVTKERDSEKGSHAYSYKRATEAEAIIEDIATFLDLASPIPREAEFKGRYGTETKHYPLLVRIAAWAGKVGTPLIGCESVE